MAEEVTVAEAAALLGMTVHNVRYLVRVGRLPARRIGQRVLVIPRDDVEAYAVDASSRQRPGPRPTRPTGRPTQEDAIHGA